MGIYEGYIGKTNSSVGISMGYQGKMRYFYGVKGKNDFLKGDRETPRL